jgi:hypothetical protein
VLHRLGASDDEAQLRGLLVLCDIAEGRLAPAREELARIDRIQTRTTSFGVHVFRHICRAELLLASGDPEGGLRLYRECSVLFRQTDFPDVTGTGTELWNYFGDSLALSAHAFYAAGADEDHGRTLFASCRASAERVLAADNDHLDYPASGLMLFGLGAWGLLHKAAPVPDALRLLALARRFAYNQMLPTTAWERITPAAETASPGLLGELQAEYAARRPPDLVAEAWRAAQRLPAEAGSR